jgi:hypothetical protein
MSHHRMNSAFQIAKAMDCEGFTDHTASLVERYWKRNVMTYRKARQIARLEQALADMAANMSVGDRLVLGKFVGLHKKMAFDTGLRMGLTCMAMQNPQDYSEREIAGLPEKED